MDAKYTIHLRDIFSSLNLLDVRKVFALNEIQGLMLEQLQRATSYKF